MKTGDECWLDDGRKAYYAGEINGQTFVRVAMTQSDPDFGEDEWPSDKLTPVPRVHASEPVEVHGPQTQRMLERIDEIRGEESAVRASVLALRREEQELQKAAARHPDVRTALDFLEGRITHVLSVPDYGKPSIVELDEFLREEDFGRQGMKLVCLFGTDSRGRTAWRRNQFRDGSGSGWTTFEPFGSHEDALNRAGDLLEAELAEWRASTDENKHKLLGRVVAFRNLFPIMPDDVEAALAEVKAKQRAEKMEKLRAQLAELEAES